ncbi:uncharacterized protein G2W53_036891 [Senna tora]|uniref:Uncharacterized protein n=1 Tax=Senna tora TaxID=362788 RepID=A0A834SVA9_9FABA|nr:uncharacterized protein G2W53_036891 [Senna tora]
MTTIKQNLGIEHRNEEINEREGTWRESERIRKNLKPGSSERKIGVVGICNCGIGDWSVGGNRENPRKWKTAAIN